jgi:LPXTG-motif cell wall-anchored protein
MQNNGPTRDPIAEGPSTPPYRGHSGFALAGGAAVVLGAGAMFVVRRRRNGDAAA